jgi:hypothetical protein
MVLKGTFGPKRGRIWEIGEKLIMMSFIIFTPREIKLQ